MGSGQNGPTTTRCILSSTSQPLQAWSDGLGRRLGRPRQPAHAESFFLDFLPGKRRFIRRDGIRLFNLRYWANVLSPVAGRTAKPAIIKYDPRNLSRVFWQDGVPLSSEPKRTLSSDRQTSARWERRWFSARSMYRVSHKANAFNRLNHGVALTSCV
jgi:hypothetical protein